MSMTMNDEIRRSPIEDDSQLTVAEHPVLGERLTTERRCGRCEVKRRDAHVGVERQQRTLERLTLAARATVLREVASDKQEVGVLRESGQTRDRARFFSTPNMEVPNRGNPHPHVIRGAHLRD